MARAKLLALLSVLLISVFVSSLFISACSSQPSAPTTAPKPTSTSAPSPVPTVSTQVYEFKLQTHSPVSNMVYEIGRSEFDYVEKASNGRIKVKFYSDSQLVPTNDALQGLGKGTFDILLSAIPYFSGVSAAATYFTVPMLFKDNKAIGDHWYGTDAQKIVSGAYEKKANSYMIGPQHQPPSHLFLRKGVTVRNAADVKGLKVKVSGPASGEAVLAWGAVPLTIAMGEIYDAQSKGLVDASFLPMYALETYKLSDVTTEVLFPALGFGSYNAIWWNVKSFNSLPADLQALVRKTLQDRFYADCATWDKYSADVEARLRQAGKIDFYEMPAAQVDSMKAAAAPSGWTWYLNTMEKQGQGAEAAAVKALFGK